jgi:hypothetical protein
MTETGPGRARDIIALLHEFGDRWEIEAHPGGTDTFSATRRTGTEVRVIVARTPRELFDKLTVAEAGDG